MRAPEEADPLGLDAAAKKPAKKAKPAAAKAAKPKSKD